MLLYLQHNAHSTQPEYAACFIMNTIHSMGYTSEPVNYNFLKENEITAMSLAYAEKSFADGWEVTDEENDYWNSFIK